MLPFESVMLYGGPYDKQEIRPKKYPDKLRILDCSGSHCDGIAIASELLIYGVYVYKKVSDGVYVYEGDQ